MADKKITDLTVLTGTLAGTDLIPVVEDPTGAGTGAKTVKVPVSTIVPASGAADEILVKSSATNYDTEWKAPFLPKVAVLEWRGVSGANGPSVAKNVLAPALYGTFAYNNIAGLTSPSAGHLTFPVGVFFITMTLHPYRTLQTRLYIRVDSTAAIALSGATAYASSDYTNRVYSACLPTLSGVLTVTDATEIYDLLVSVGRSDIVGKNDVYSFVSYETYGQVTIQQLSD